MSNLLLNQGFELGKFNKVDQWGSMTVPQSWQAFFVNDPGSHKVPWDPNNATGIVAPEFKPVNTQPPYLNPPRVHSGTWAMCWFAFWKVMDAGLYQQAKVIPGQKLHFSAWAHGWSNSGSDAISGKRNHDPKWSDGTNVGYADYFKLADPNWPKLSFTGNPQVDATPNMIFQLGIDPTGGTNAWASTVVWGPAAHIYNVYHEVPPVEAVAQGDTVTVFLRTRNLWGFMHNDAYWDDPVLEAVGEPVPQPTPPPPIPSDHPTPVTPPAVTGASKLGAHILVMNDDGAKFIAAGPAVVKFVGDWGSAGNAPSGTLVIGRKVSDGDAQQMRASGLPSDQAVHKFIYGQGGFQNQTYQSNPAIKYWEGYNEPVWGDLDGMKWYADFEIARMQEMAKLGLKCVIGNFATGTPPLELWPGFFDALHAAKQYGAILGLHEYSRPWIWWMTGRYQMQAENNVNPQDPTRTWGWTTLRYRQVYDTYLAPAGLGDVPLVITEFGIDGLVNPAPARAPASAWRGQGDYWKQHKDDEQFDYVAQKYPLPAGVVWNDDPAQFYFEQLRWYDREIQKDAFVIGATIFTFGNFGGDWAAFDVTGSNGAAGLLTDYVQQSKSTTPVPPTPTPPPPTPTPPPPAPTTMIVQPDVIKYAGLKIRWTRDVNSPFVEALPAGARVTVLEGPIMEGGDPWVRVRTAAGNEGWARISGDGETYLVPAS